MAATSAVTFSDIFAVFVCAITPAASVLALLGIIGIEKYTVRLLGGTRNHLGNDLLRRKVKAVLELLLQLVSVGILLKMIHLMALEVLEVISEAKEADDKGEGKYLLTIGCILLGIIPAIIMVWFVEGGGDDHGEDHGKHEGHAASPSSSRGVIIAMLLHTCSEGLSAGIVMSNGEEGVSSMFDISSAYFISLALHNVSEGLVVATAVRNELVEESSRTKRTRPSNSDWVATAAVKTTLSHIGQPLGLLAILFAPQLGLSGLTNYPLFIAFIQGVSLGSIAAAVLCESLPEVWKAAVDFARTFSARAADVSKKRKTN